ncbi:MAG: hypothetical protein Q8940_15770 [Bacteroidota bacterium]|nr:hypothetical protein [Bacteroidota bacterium]
MSYRLRVSILKSYYSADTFILEIVLLVKDVYLVDFGVIKIVSIPIYFKEKKSIFG